MRASGDSSTLLLSASQTTQWASVIPKSSCCHQTPTTHCRCHTEAAKPGADSPSCRKIEVWSTWMTFSSGQYPSFVPKMLKICLGKSSISFHWWTLSAQGVLTMQLTAARDLKKKKIWTKCPSYKWPHTERASHGDEKGESLAEITGVPATCCHCLEYFLVVPEN